MPQFRQSFKYSINDMVYVSWENKFIEARISEIHITGAGIHYTVKNIEGKYRMFHDSEVAKSPMALAMKMAKLSARKPRGEPELS